MKNRQRNQALFFAFLNLTIVLTFLGSPSYAGIELDINVLESIRDPIKTPDLRQFSDTDIQQIFMDIAKNNSTKYSNKYSKHFLERIEKYKAQHSYSEDLDRQTKPHTYTHAKHVPILFEEMANSLLAEERANFLIALGFSKTVSTFNYLITLINNSGNKINGDDTIEQNEKNNIFEEINNHAIKAYLEALHSTSSSPSLKIALVNRLESVTHRIPTVFRYVLDFFRSSNDAQKH